MPRQSQKTPTDKKAHARQTARKPSAFAGKAPKTSSRKEYEAERKASSEKPARKPVSRKPSAAKPTPPASAKAAPSKPVSRSPAAKPAPRASTTKPRETPSPRYKKTTPPLPSPAAVPKASFFENTLRVLKSASSLLILVLMAIGIGSLISAHGLLQERVFNPTAYEALKESKNKEDFPKLSEFEPLLAESYRGDKANGVVNFTPTDDSETSKKDQAKNFAEAKKLLQSTPCSLAPGKTWWDVIDAATDNARSEYIDPAASGTNGGIIGGYVLQGNKFFSVNQSLFGNGISNLDSSAIIVHEAAGHLQTIPKPAKSRWWPVRAYQAITQASERYTWEKLAYSAQNAFLNDLQNAHPKLSKEIDNARENLKFGLGQAYWDTTFSEHNSWTLQSLSSAAHVSVYWLFFSLTLGVLTLGKKRSTRS